MDQKLKYIQNSSIEILNNLDDQENNNQLSKIKYKMLILKIQMKVFILNWIKKLIEKNFWIKILI